MKYHPEEAWSYHGEIADIYYKQKDYCEALKHYKIFFDSIRKSLATEMYNYGLARYYCHDTASFAQAQAIFLKVTELAPKASIGWYWTAKAAAEQDPDLEKHPELLPEYGKGMIYYEKYLSIAEVDPKKHRDDDLLKAYKYCIEVHIKKGNIPAAKEYAAKGLLIAPEDEYLIETRDKR